MPSTGPSSAADRPYPDGRESRAAVEPADASPGQQPEPAFYRGFVASVVGGLDGALRVAIMLHGRNYQVRDLTFEACEGAVLSKVRVTVLLTTAQADLLAERLRRIPAVVSAAEG
jgi:hypothetical protein